MSIAVIALFYGAQAIRVQQAPVPVPWVPRDHASNGSVMTGGDIGPVKAQAAKEHTESSYKKADTGIYTSYPVIPIPFVAPKGIIKNDAPAPVVTPAVIPAVWVPTNSLMQQAPVPVPWVPRTHTANIPVNGQGDGGPVAGQAAKEVAESSYRKVDTSVNTSYPVIPIPFVAPKGIIKNDAPAPVVTPAVVPASWVPTNSLMQGAPQAPVPVAWTPRDHASNAPVNGNGDIAMVKDQAAKEVANWSYRSLAQGAPQPPVAVDWKPRDHKDNWAAKKGAEVPMVTDQAAKEVANWSYRSLSQINPQHPEGLVPQRSDNQYDGIQQLKKPLNWENASEVDDFKDVFNPDKKPDPGAYSQVSEPNPVPINGGSDAENYNTANLSGRPYRVLEQNGPADVRTMSNRWEGNPEYKSSYDYKLGNNAFEITTPKPKYLNAQVNEPNPVPINGGSDYETYNNANLSGRPYRVLEQNGPADVRTMSNRWEGNPEYKSSYAYTSLTRDSGKQCI